MRRWLLGGVLALVGGIAHASPPAIAQHTCPNGLTVLVVENHALPLLTVEITAKNGSMTEPPEYNGLSHLYEHMFFKANAVLPNQEAYLARTRELGMEFNGTTSQERVNYYFTTTSDHFADAMTFMRDAVVSPKFGADELDREREVVVGEIDRDESSPYYRLNEAIEHKVWWKYPSRKDPLGDRKTVRSATVEMMQTIQHRYYVPNNSALVVTGDVDAQAVFALADQIYAGWPKAEDPFVKFPLVTHPPIPKSEVVVLSDPAVQTFTAEVTWQGPSTVGPTVNATYAADVLGTALGDPSSKFQKALVDSGLCVEAGLNWFTQENVGPITLELQAEPAKADGCVQAAFAELAKIKSPDYFADAELANAKHQLDVGQVKDREKPSSLAHTLTFWWTSAGLDYYVSYAANTAKVTREDIAAYLDAFVLAKPYVLGALVSPDVEKGGMNKDHLEKLLGIAAPPPVEPPSPPKGAKTKSKKGGR